VLIASATGAITKGDLIAPEDGVAGKSLDGPINMLLLGVDVRPDWDINDTRADPPAHPAPERVPALALLLPGC